MASRPAEWLQPAGAPAGKVLLYLHGGAYVLGSPSTHRQLVSHIARAANVNALLPDYRLAPEHRFPAAIDDAVSIYEALLHGGCTPGDIAVAGDSAGGGLTMATLLTLRDAGIPLPACACLLSPWLDLTGSGESMRTHAHRDPWFRPEDLGVVTSFYCDSGERRNPRVSPVFAELHDLPPLYIQVGEDEILLSDSTRLADGVRARGGEAELEIWPGMWHVFQIFVNHVPEARKAVDRLGRRIGAALGVTTGSES
jgi:acetyl esterase/lipase